MGDGGGGGIWEGSAECLPPSHVFSSGRETS